MKNIRTVMIKELISMFTSWRAYIVIAVFMILTGIFFSNLMFAYSNVSTQYARSPQRGKMEVPSRLNVNDIVVKNIFGNINVILLFIIPAITMRLMSEEKKKGTVELLLTSPISEVQIILGKFFAAMFTVFVMLSTTLLIPFFLYAYTDPDWGPVWTSYLGLILLASSFVAVGIFCSSLTRSQIIAMILTFGVLLVFYIINQFASSATGHLRDFLEYCSLIKHFDGFSKGLISTKDILYYLSFTFLALFGTHQIMLSKRWR